jgi:phosphoribosylaminoimidazole (AIR) synthetase
MVTSTYAQSGVNLDAGDDASKIMFDASRLTWTNRSGIPGEISLSFDSFSSVRFVDVARFPDAIIGMNFDGVGTKIEVAERVVNHLTIAFDLFAMVCDDAARTGGEPILLGSILDCRKVSSGVIRDLANGMIAAANAAQVAVINGEVA